MMGSHATAVFTEGVFKPIEGEGPLDVSEGQIVRLYVLPQMCVPRRTPNEIKQLAKSSKDFWAEMEAFGPDGDELSDEEFEEELREFSK